MPLSPGHKLGPYEILAFTRKGGMVLLLTIAGATGMVRAQPPAPDLILSNGKIITVDERFTIAQAVAIRGDRIVAVGTNQEIARLAGPNTRTIDLAGRAVIPGLIDNHMHLLRAATTWPRELRFDGVESRQTGRSRCCAPGRKRRGRGNGSITSAAGPINSSRTIQNLSRAKSWTGSRRTIRSRCRNRTIKFF